MTPGRPERVDRLPRFGGRREAAARPVSNETRTVKIAGGSCLAAHGSRASACFAGRPTEPRRISFLFNSSGLLVFCCTSASERKAQQILDQILFLSGRQPEREARVVVIDDRVSVGSGRVQLRATWPLVVIYGRLDRQLLWIRSTQRRGPC